MSVRKLRILCLHGYQQDAATFRLKSGGFRKRTRALAEYAFLDAPLVINGDPEKRGWMYNDKNTTPTDCPEDPTGLQRSLDAVGAIVEGEGPFDGMLAFSQGASFAAFLLHLIQEPQSAFKVNPKIGFRFVVVACGVESRIHTFKSPIDIPSLHLIGKTDQIIPPEQAQGFSHLFKCPEIFEYDGGHHVPSSGETSDVIRSFFKKFSKTD